MLKEIIEKNRSYRRFYEDHEIPLEKLTELIDLARICPSSRNIQPLKYIISNTKKKNDKIFPHLAWAGYIKDWDKPEPGEQPSAYIIILGDKYIFSLFNVDLGIAAQTILLGAAEMGYGGCMVGSIERKKLRAELQIPDRYEILLCLALGKPKEEVVLEEVKDDNIEYYRDEKQVHHVPKRKLDDIILDF